MPRTMEPGDAPSGNLLLPVLPVRETCLFPEASLTLVTAAAPALRAVEVAQRTGGRLLAVCTKDEGTRETHAVGTIAHLAEDLSLSEGGHRIELDGQRRARVVSLMGMDPWVAEATPLSEGDPGDDWRPAAVGVARYLPAPAALRPPPDHQRRPSLRPPSASTARRSRSWGSSASFPTSACPTPPRWPSAGTALGPRASPATFSGSRPSFPS